MIGPSGGKGRSGAARGPEKKFAKRGFAGKDASKSDGERRPYAGKPDGMPRANPMARSPIRARANPTPASAKAPRRASTGTTAALRGEKRPYTPRGDRPN